MKISIAMATYNGSMHLPQQLDSFLAQTRLPDELVVCDDHSTDGTVEILTRFVERAPFSVRIIPNEHRLGYSANFAKAVGLCDGDAIFLSDQDDLWFANKLQVIESFFETHSEAMVILNDQVITDENLVESGRSIFSNTRALGFKEAWLSAGCCTAVRAQYLPILLPFPHDLIPYDGWIHRLSVSLDVRVLCREVLQKYRRHAGNSSESLAASSHRPTHLTALKAYGLADVKPGWLKEIELSHYISRVITERFMDLRSLGLEENAVRALRTEACLRGRIKDRAEIVRQRRSVRVFKVAAFLASGGYSSFLGWKSAIKDILR